MRLIQADQGQGTRAAAPVAALWHAGQAEPRNGLDVETAAMLRAWLAPDIEAARSWEELSERLARKGFLVGFIDGRLSLIAEGSGVVLCSFRFLGHGFAELRNRLGRPHVLVRDGRKALGVVMH